MRKKYLTKNPAQTKKLGKTLATELLKKAKGEKRTGFSLSKEVLKIKLLNKALIIGLEGDLGGGKTTLLQGLAKGLGIKQKILSPTFIILKKFKIRKPSPTKRGEVGDEVQPQRSSNFKNFYHIDCYRIQKPKEILGLGFKEIISNSQNIVAVEWSDKIKKILPKSSIILKFQFVNKNSRKIWLMKRKN